MLEMRNERLFRFWRDLGPALKTGEPQNEIKHSQKPMDHNARMREIDGSFGESGGQLLRKACALAAITGAPPGLAPRHLTAVKAVAALCDARVEGLELRSEELVFHPGKLRGGSMYAGEHGARLTA